MSAVIALQPGAATPRAANRTTRLPLEFRLYAWSLLLEPLTFFLLSDQVQAGLALTLARLVQTAFVIVFGARLLLTNTRWVVPNPLFRHYRYFTLYLVLATAASLAGVWLYGTYVFQNAPREDLTSFATQVLRGTYSRPFVEVGILLYYFVYFAVLPKYFFTSPREFAYYFKWFIRLLWLMLAIGFADLALQLTGLGYLPKFLIHPEFGYVGPRFHALLGEPRDAFPYLVFAIALLYLRRELWPRAKISRLLVPLTFIALLLTQSGSGVIGLAIGALGAVLYFSATSIRKLATTIAMLALGAGAVAIMVSSSPRLMQYIEMFSELWDILNAGDKLPYLAAVQSSDFLPLWQMWTNVRDTQLAPVVFGSGVGTTSIVNNNLSAVLIEDATSELMNPHAQITRVLFEGGIVGFLVYVAIFTAPVRELVRRLPVRSNAVFILFLLLLGASLSHRSTAVFMYLGFVIALLANWPSMRRARPPRVRVPAARAGAT